MDKYTYSIANDTANGAVDLSSLTEEIHDSAIVTALDYCISAGDVLDTWFKAALSSGDQTILTSVVNAHTGEPLPSIDSVVVDNISEATPGDLILTWPQLKSFYDSVSAACLLNYVDLSTHYYVWLSFRDQKMYIPELVKGTSDCNQFEASYKSKCNIPEFTRVRTTTCKAGRKLHNRYITFRTACDDPDWQLDNTDYLDQPFGDVAYIMKDASGAVTTVGSAAKETWISFEPTFDYELSGGALFVDDTLGGDLWMWECHVLAVPDVPAQLGGCIIFIANPRLEWIRSSYMEINSDINPSELKYSATYHTNKIRVIIKHPVGEQADLQLVLRLFK